MNPLKLFLRVLYRIRKESFIRDFQRCDISVGFVLKGQGQCKVAGKEYIRIGKDSNFGEGCELIVYGSATKADEQPLLNVGNHVRVTARCRITCAGHITIEDDVLMAPDVFRVSRKTRT